ncbi:hypothetical protein J2X36_000768 [Methylobacterium sp. BE186]|nr:hypothetical protein [Methylobacterium sp. BE186]
MMCFARHLEAQAEHWSALGQCGSEKDAVDLRSALLMQTVCGDKAKTTQAQDAIRARAA